MSAVPPKAPLLAQVPATELVPNLSSAGPGDASGRTRVRRRVGLSRARKRLVSLLFLSLGIMSVMALGRGAVAVTSDGLSGDDALLLAMLALITLVVVSQALSLVRTLPGVRNIWMWVARARLRRAGPIPRRPLLAQAGARSLVPEMTTVSKGRTARRLRPFAQTAGWVALTLVIMAVAMAGAGLVAASAVRSIDSRGWGPSTLLTLGFATLIGYGVTALSIGLVRSWFERRRRRLRRMLMRLLRYLLRGFDRATTALPRLLGRFDRGTGLLGRGVLAFGGAAIVVAASLSMPVAAAGGVVNSDENPAASPTPPSTTTTAVHAVAVDHENTPGVDAGPQGGDSVELAVSDPAPAVTVALPGEGTTTTSTTGTTTTTVTKKTTTTTTVPPDTTGPTVGGISDGPDPIFTSGTSPDTSQIMATANDPSGVANMTVYYRLGGGGFAVWMSVKGGAVSTTFGPFGTLGTYEYRIMATDTLGNANCKTPASCPGGSVTVLIP